MVRKHWSSIVVSGCGLHFFVSIGFGSFGFIANFSTAERSKNIFFTAMKIRTMARIVKKQNNFMLFFISLVTKTCQMCFSCTVGYGIIVITSLFNLY